MDLNTNTGFLVFNLLAVGVTLSIAAIGYFMG